MICIEYLAIEQRRMEAYRRRFKSIKASLKHDEPVAARPVFDDERERRDYFLTLQGRRR